MFRQLVRVTLSAGVSVALAAAIGIPASAHAAAAWPGGPGGYPAGRAVPGGPGAGPSQTVNVAGELTWTLVTVPYQSGATVSGNDTTTITAHIGWTKLDLATDTPAADSSTYSLADNLDETFIEGKCTLHETGSFTGGGSLAWGESSPFPPPPYPVGEVDFTLNPPNKPSAMMSLDVPFVETLTYVTTGPPPCPSTNTLTVTVNAIPGCSNGNVPGFSGVFDGTWPDGTVDLNCSGTSGTPGQSAVFSWKVTGHLAVSTDCVPPNELSAPDWVQQFPDSKLVSDLAAPFQQNVARFIKAMRQAGISVPPKSISTRRPLQRQYLMYYSWLIANKQMDPKNVPKFKPPAGQAPVNICWVHTNASHTEDLRASVAAAQQMVDAYHIVADPGQQSRHTEGLAIDMNTTWTQPSITIANGDGTPPTTIDTTPHTGLNKQLMAVGLTYGVHHFCYPPGTCKTKVPAKDPIHWSDNGH
jgi:hypothetical protein